VGNPPFAVSDRFVAGALHDPIISWRSNSDPYGTKGTGQ
jgi:hypothetical protein